MSDKSEMMARRYKQDTDMLVSRINTVLEQFAFNKTGEYVGHYPNKYVKALIIGRAMSFWFYGQARIIDNKFGEFLERVGK